MIRQSWLIVTNIMAHPDNATQWHLIRTVNAVGNKAKKLAEEYSKELNNGRTMEDCVKEKKDYLSVCNIPWSQAREYVVNRDKIDNAPQYCKGEGICVKS